jgi:hypothetical protein
MIPIRTDRASLRDSNDAVNMFWEMPEEPGVLDLPQIALRNKSKIISKNTTTEKTAERTSTDTSMGHSVETASILLPKLPMGSTSIVR